MNTFMPGSQDDMKVKWKPILIKKWYLYEKVEKYRLIQRSMYIVWIESQKIFCIRRVQSESKCYMEIQYKTNNMV